MYMRSPRPVAAVLMLAALSVCILAAVCNLAVAGPLPRTTHAVATVAPDVFPAEFRDMGRVAVYFEAASVIMSLTLLGQILELRARSQTSAAIRSLLGLAPKTARR